MKNQIKDLLKANIKREERLINDRDSYKYSPSTINVFSAVLVSIRGLWIDHTPENTPYLRFNSL